MIGYLKFAENSTSYLGTSQLVFAPAFNRFGIASLELAIPIRWQQGLAVSDR